jgi:hypothetical protein
MRQGSKKKQPRVAHMETVRYAAGLKFAVSMGLNPDPVLALWVTFLETTIPGNESAIRPGAEKEGSEI